MTIALSLALVFNALSLVLYVGPVSAAAVTDLSVTMTRQDKDEDTAFDIQFVTPTGIETTTDTITVTFQTGFDLTGILFSDVDLEDDTVDETIAAAPGAGEWGFAFSGQVMTFSPPSDAIAIAADSIINIKIGTLADSGVNLMDNPSTAATYSIDIAGVFGDTGTAYVPILDDDFVTINADVESHIQFDIDIDDIGAVGSGHNTNDAAPYTIDLQDLIFTSITDEDTASVEEIYFDLSTNASGGAIIQMQSAGDADLDSASTGGTITSSTETLAVDTNLGGWGLACDEQFPSNNGAGDSGTLTEVSPFNVYGVTGGVGGVTTSFQTIFNTGGAAIQDGDGTCSVRAISGNQTLAADDYTETLRFRATATF